MSVTEYRLPCYGIVVLADPETGSGRITSNLKQKDSEFPEEMDKGYDNAIDGIEAMILGHACAGMDICDPAYVEGVEAAIDSITNQF